MNKKDTQNLKQSLWAAADKLRSNMSPADYKYTVLGLIFLKYISDAFEGKMQRLTKELGEQLAESHKLEKEIKANLRKIGFEL